MTLTINLIDQTFDTPEAIDKVYEETEETNDWVNNWFNYIYNRSYPSYESIYSKKHIKEKGGRRQRRRTKRKFKQKDRGLLSRYYSLVREDRFYSITSKREAERSERKIISEGLAAYYDDSLLLSEEEEHYSEIEKLKKYKNWCLYDALYDVLKFCEDEDIYCIILDLISEILPRI